MTLPKTTHSDSLDLLPPWPFCQLLAGSTDDSTGSEPSIEINLQSAMT